MPRLRVEPEDFVVEELPLYEPSGEGGHTFVWIEKRDRTTEQVRRDLARAAGVAPREVGAAGRKDRRAVTRQWLSVPDLDPERALALELPGARVLRAARHRHKLRTGHLRANRFELVVRDVTPGQIEAARARAAELEAEGLPNRFGPQRYGRSADNAERGRAILEGRLRVRDRREARFLLSALQSAVFDAVLAERPLPPGALEVGDVAVVHASGGLFRVEDLAREAPRAAAFEVSATGPIFGPRAPVPAGAPAAREAAVLRRLGLDPERLPPRVGGVRLAGARRPLRVRVAGLRLGPAGPGALRLCFTLPPGSYATVLVSELVPGVETGGG